MDISLTQACKGKGALWKTFWSQLLNNCLFASVTVEFINKHGLGAGFSASGKYLGLSRIELHDHVPEATRFEAQQPYHTRLLEPT